MKNINFRSVKKLFVLSPLIFLTLPIAAMDPALGKVMHYFNQIPEDLRHQIVSHVRESYDEFKNRLFEEKKHELLKMPECKFISDNSIENNYAYRVINKKTKKVDYCVDTQDYIDQVVPSFDKRFWLLAGKDYKSNDKRFFTINHIENKQPVSLKTADSIVSDAFYSPPLLACSNNGKLMALYSESYRNLRILLVFRKKENLERPFFNIPMVLSENIEIKNIDFNLQNTALGIAAVINGKKYVATLHLNKEPKNLIEYYQVQEPSKFSEINEAFILTDDHFELLDESEERQ